MKNRNVLKLALIGALVGIVLFDIINIVLYLTKGFCLKIENTESLIVAYIFSAIYAAVAVMLYFKLKKLEASDKSVIKKGLYMFLYVMVELLIFEGAIAIQEIVFQSKEAIIVVLLESVILMGIGVVVQMLVFIFNKGNVKEINKKIKEKVLEDK